ncbi:hypothetical protein [Megasphaera stantonii]|uniref:hypothetical protein n=1 Tax=Megasphaera stantonii TaxID=2144175 RepID=UPI001D644807|nr:hypothetical protein [Megasphaera stantonii]HJE82942.1 hypothetical protein [Megasphaera stantonii]
MDSKTLKALKIIYDNSHFYKVDIINLNSFLQDYQSEYDFLIGNEYLAYDGRYVRITSSGLSLLGKSLEENSTATFKKLDKTLIVEIAFGIISTVIGILQISLH